MSTSSTTAGNGGDQPTAATRTSTGRAGMQARSSWAFLASHPQELLVCLCFVVGLLTVALSATNLAASRARRQGGGAAAAVILAGASLTAVPPAMAFALFLGGFFEPEAPPPPDPAALARRPPWWAFLPVCTWDLLRCLCFVLGSVEVSISATTRPLTWQSKTIIAAGTFLMAMPPLTFLMCIYCGGAVGSKTVRAAEEQANALPPQGSPADTGAAERVLNHLQEQERKQSSRPLFGRGEQTSTPQPQLTIGIGQRDGGGESSTGDRVRPQNFGKGVIVDKGSSSSSEIVSESESDSED